jgi:nucleotide-binding universal stress UspA family protein
MNRSILLAVSTSRYSRHLVATAIHEARALRDGGATVIIDLLIVQESEELERVGQRVGDVGFLGLSPQRDVLEALGQEHDRQARRMAERVMEAAKAASFEVRRTEVRGTFAKTVLDHAQAHDSDLILLTRADRPFISRILFGTEADTVARHARRDGLGRVIIDE